MKSQFAFFDPGPDASLHLRDSKQAGFPTLLQSGGGFGERLAGVDVENRDPL